MLTPYDWQEGIGHRAGYVESRLAQGSPVLAASIPEGIVIYTATRETTKLFEVYDRLAFSAIGQQSDIEAIRVAAVEFAHREGFNRSEDDVTIQRVVAGLSDSIKRAFADFNTSPVVARCLFAEAGASPAEDRFFLLDYDGDYWRSDRTAVLCAGEERSGYLQAEMDAEDFGAMTHHKAITALRRVYKSTSAEGEEGMVPEAVLLSRDPNRENRFVALEPTA